MTSAHEAVLWTMLTGVDAARDHIRSAAVESGLRTTACNEDCISVEVPFSLRKRLRIVRLTATLRPSARGVEVAWTADAGPLNHEHLAWIEEALPDGVMYDHGLTDAALNAGLSLGGKATLGVIARSLAQEETVRAIGLGHLNETAGYVVLTTKRFLVIEVSPNPEHFSTPRTDRSKHFRWGKETPERLSGSYCPRVRPQFHGSATGKATASSRPTGKNRGSGAAHCPLRRGKAWRRFPILPGKSSHPQCRSRRQRQNMAAGGQCAAAGRSMARTFGGARRRQAEANEQDGTRQA
jgi:hypothetical protein